MAWFYPAFLALISLIYYLDRSSRKRMGAAALLALCSFAGLLVVGAFGSPGGGFSRMGLLLSRLLAAIAAVNVAGALSFSLLLPKLGARIPRLMEDLILAAAYVAAGLAVSSASGANLSGLMATSALVTAVVAISLQDTLGNILGGMVLHLENSFVPGDRIRIDGNEGVVREIRWRQTTLETLDGDLVIIPNIILMKSTVVVVGSAAGNKSFRTALFNVYYDRAPGEVIRAVERALKDDPPECVAVDPPPACVIRDFRESCVSYEARYWLTDLSMPGTTDSKVRSRIYYALSREGIKLSIPSRSIMVTEGARDAVEKGRKEEMDRRIRALKGIYVFGVLSDAEREVLAGRLIPTPFAAGEVITRQGAVADWLYMIYEGNAEVRVHSGHSGAYRAVKTLGPGDFLGEMGLLTGEPRSATAVAVSDVRCYRLDREGFGEVLSSRPEIAEAIALMLAKRRMELEEAKGAMASSDSGGLKNEQQNLFSKIKTFFNL